MNLATIATALITGATVLAAAGPAAGIPSRADTVSTTAKPAPSFVVLQDPEKPRVAPARKSPEAIIRADRNESSSVSTKYDSTGPSPWKTRLVEQACSNNGTNFCMAYACGNPDEVGYLIQRRLRSRPESSWEVIGETCQAPEGPVLTPGRVLEEVRRIGLPAGSVEAPPETFVNYDTVVYTEAETFARTVTLLGFTVDLEATPLQFHWAYGDGETETTTTAGRPYPKKDITHTWTDAHRTFRPSLPLSRDCLKAGRLMSWAW